MQLSTIPFLIAGLFGFVGWLALRATPTIPITPLPPDFRLPSTPFFLEN